MRGEIVIIGGGAAGLMAAIAAADAGAASVRILERNPSCGAKILVSGGGRCNLTNQNLSAEHFHGSSRHAIRNVLAAFDQDAAMRFFEGLGVPLVTEEEGRVFPASHRAHDVLAALLSRAEKLRVQIETRCLVRSARVQEQGFAIDTASGERLAHRLLIAAGGAAFPQVGTDGSGFRLAASLGHSIVDPVPALVPIACGMPELQGLAGITVEAELTLSREGKTIARTGGSLLFTHEGISGPAALNISRELSRHQQASLSLNLIPGSELKAVETIVRDAITSRPRAQAVSLLHERLPERLCAAIVTVSGVDPKRPSNELSRGEIASLARAFGALPLPGARTEGFDEAHATAGGVPLAEVRYQTLASRLVPGLFLAGEVLDVDGDSGGYNLQWAWSSGYLSGRAAAAAERS